MGFEKVFGGGGCGLGEFGFDGGGEFASLDCFAAVDSEFSLGEFELVGGEC